MLNYNKLKIFFTVAQTLNFTRASEELFISQSAVSRHMKELEEELGAVLFIRTNRDLILTEAGRVLYQEIAPFYSREEEILRKVYDAAGTGQKELRIGFMGIQQAFHIPAIVNNMLLTDANLSIRMKRYNWDEIEPAVESYKIDVALRLRMGSFDASQLDHQILDAAPPAIVTSDRHPAASKESVCLEDFKNDHFLMLSETDSALPNSFTHMLFKKHGFQPRKLSVYDQPETILMMIHSDAGISLLSRFAATDQFPDLRVLDISIPDMIYLELIWRRSDSNPMIRLSVEQMKELFTSAYQVPTFSL